MFESVYHGVPLVTMPVFCDHDVNAAKAVADGYALRLDLETLTSDKLSKLFGCTCTDLYINSFVIQFLRYFTFHFKVKGILKVIHDERYRQAVK